MNRMTLRMSVAAVFALTACSTSSGKGPDSASSCPSIDDACTAEGSVDGISYRCVRDWATAQSPSTWCGPNEYAYLYPSCNGFNVVAAGPMSDVGTLYYYSMTTGELIGIGLSSANTQSTACLGGTVPSMSLSGCLDGGVPIAICGQSLDGAATE